MRILAENRVAASDVKADKTAVLAIHWQEEIVGSKGAFGKMFAPAVKESGVIPNVAKVLQKARSLGALVIYVNIAFRPGYVGIRSNNALFNATIQSNLFIRGMPGLQVIPELAPHPNDVVVEHGSISSFAGTDLLNILIERQIETLAVTGVATNVAVDHTIRDAAQYGFRTILLEDCCCSSDPAHHQAALLTLRVLATDILTSDQFVTVLSEK